MIYSIYVKKKKTKKNILIKTVDIHRKQDVEQRSGTFELILVKKSIHSLKHTLASYELGIVLHLQLMKQVHAPPFEWIVLHCVISVM